MISVVGDDGSTKLFYDGKTAILLGAETNKYVTVPVPNTIQGMLETVMGKLGVDFPLADFLTDNPDKSFLSGVTSGREINTVTIDGVPCRHLLFTQPPGIELEIWLEKNDKALPRRLMKTWSSSNCRGASTNSRPARVKVRRTGSSAISSHISGASESASVVPTPECIDRVQYDPALMRATEELELFEQASRVGGIRGVGNTNCHAHLAL